MPILAFQKPDKVIMLEADNSFGKFEFRPLEPGYGQTIGNAFRRLAASPYAPSVSTELPMSWTQSPV